MNKLIGAAGLDAVLLPSSTEAKFLELGETVEAWEFPSVVVNICFNEMSRGVVGLHAGSRRGQRLSHGKTKRSARHLHADPVLPVEKGTLSPGAPFGELLAATVMSQCYANGGGSDSVNAQPPKMIQKAPSAGR